VVNTKFYSIAKMFVNFHKIIELVQ